MAESKKNFALENTWTFLSGLAFPTTAGGWLTWVFVVLCVSAIFALFFPQALIAAHVITMVLAVTFAVGVVIEGFATFLAIVAAIKEGMKKDGENNDVGAKWAAVAGKAFPALGCLIMSVGLFAVFFMGPAAIVAALHVVVPSFFAIGFALTFGLALYNASKARKKIKDKNVEIAEFEKTNSPNKDGEQCTDKIASLNREIKIASLNREIKIAKAQLGVSVAVAVASVVALGAVLGGLLMVALIPPLAPAGFVFMGVGALASAALTITSIANFVMPHFVKARHKASNDMKLEASLISNGAKNVETSTKSVTETTNEKALSEQDDQAPLLNPASSDTPKTGGTLARFFKEEHEKNRRTISAMVKHFIHGERAYNPETTKEANIKLGIN